MKKGKLIILSGPSGSGKTTLYKRLLASPRLKGRLAKIISVTTRPRRPGEKHGRDYFFVSSGMFRYKRKAGHFLESEKVFRYYYGTPQKAVKEVLRSGKSVLLCIDVKGARTVSRRYPQALKVFVKTPSLAILKKRLQRRETEKPQDLNIRLKTARQELKQSRHYDAVIINDNLAKSYARLERLILANFND